MPRTEAPVTENTAFLTADPDSAPFFAGLEDGELRLQRCERCHRYQFPPRPFCTQCSSRALSWQRAAGQGTIYSLTVCYRAGLPELSERVPFVVGLVDLVEGIRLLAPLELEPDQAAIGLPVSAVFNRTPDRVKLAFAPKERTERG
jgi:uncharacterized OB-fold protein